MLHIASSSTDSYRFISSSPFFVCVSAPASSSTSKMARNELSAVVLQEKTKNTSCNIQQKNIMMMMMMLLVRVVVVVEEAEKKKKLKWQ